MKRPESHKTDSLAQNILSRAITPRGWILYPLIPDYGKDYFLEIVKDNEVSGSIFVIQLKGTRRIDVQLSSRTFPFQMDTNTLKYLADKVQFPGFLVLCDTSSGIGYYLFIQEYLRAIDKSGKSWRQRKTLNIRFHIDDRIDDPERFYSALNRADIFMKETRPGSISASIEFQKLKMRNIDPRFDCEVEVNKDGQINMHFNPKEEVKFRMILKGSPEEAQRNASDLFGRGLPVPLSGENFEVEGMPIFSEALKKGATLQIKSSIPATIKLDLIDKSGAVISSLPEYSGVLEGGSSEIRFVSRMASLPLQISFKTTIPSGDNDGAMHFTTRFEVFRWVGKKLRFLPYFNQIRNFVGAIECADKIVVTGVSEGNHLFSIGGPIGTLKKLHGAQPALDEIEKARNVSAHFDIDPEFPRDFFEKHLDDVEELFALATTGEYESPRRFTFEITVACREEMSLPLKSDGVLGLEMTHPSNYDFLGVKFLLQRKFEEFRGGEIVAGATEICPDSGRRIVTLNIKNAIRKQRLALPISLLAAKKTNESK